MIFLKALITGASGFVGQFMSRKLLDNNIETLGISRSNSYINGRQIEDYRCDILDKLKLKTIIDSYKPEWVVHLAGPAFIPNSFGKPQETYDIIFQGTLNLLESLRETGIDSKVLFVSSADIYGSSTKEVLPESEPYDPTNPYSSAKACSELLSKQFYKTYGLNVVIARPFNHTGPGQAKDFVCSSFANQIAAMDEKSEKKLFTGNIDVKRDFLDVRDVVDAYFDLLQQGISGEEYNVCSGRAISIREVIQLLFQQTNLSNYEIIIDPKKLRKNDIPIRIGDNKKIYERTGWSPKISIEQTMRDLFLYWKENMNV